MGLRLKMVRALEGSGRKMLRKGLEVRMGKEGAN